MGRRVRRPAGYPLCSIRASAPRCRRYMPIRPGAGRWRRWPTRRAFPSTLALRFKQKAGMAPLEYVSRWRMLLAARALRTGGEPISAIAQRLGYDSDSAFSHAFKRVMACSPRDYRRAQA
ncbi:helix-turn-helix transcriptional regulator [Serratia ureilytica]